jgi:hypothetical protein
VLPWEPGSLTASFYEHDDQIVLVITGIGSDGPDEFCGTVTAHYDNSGLITSWATPNAGCAVGANPPVVEAVACDGYLVVGTDWGVVNALVGGEARLPTRLSAVLWDDLGGNPTASLAAFPGPKPTGADDFVPVGDGVFNCEMTIPAGG